MGGGGTYNLILGIKSEPPTNMNKNQTRNIQKVFYNKTGNTYNEIDPAKEISMGAVWSIKANMNIARWRHTGCGKTNGALAVCGKIGNISNPPSTMNGYCNATEAYDGINWSNRNNANIYRERLASCGTSNSALIVGGYGYNPDNYNYIILEFTELYNGTTWSLNRTSNSLGQELAACGIQNSALAFGGYNGGSYANGYTQLFDGVSWSSKSNMRQSQRHAGCGVSNSALSFGGNRAEWDWQSNAQLFNGSSWSGISSMNSARDSLGGSGVSNNALAFGGSYDTTLGIIEHLTELYNGNAWSIVPSDLNTVNWWVTGCGESSNATLSFGGNADNDVILAVTEQFSPIYYNPDIPNWSDSAIIATLSSNKELTIS